MGPVSDGKRVQVLDLARLTDEELVAESQREGSDGPAFQCLVERFQEGVWRICYRLMSNTEDAHDAAQEVFIRLFFQRNRFEGRSKYSTWVHGVALRTCLMMRRSRGRRRRHETTTGEPIVPSTTAAEADQPSLSMDLVQMLEILNEEDRAMLILKHAESYSYDDLAEMFGMSVSACKMRLSRAREKLKRRFQNQL